MTKKKYKVTGIQTAEIEISGRSVLDKTEELINSMLNLTGYDLKGDEVVYWDYGYHGSGHCEFIRKASAEDIQAFATIKFLRSLREKC